MVTETQLPAWIPLPRWVRNPFYGHVIEDEDFEEYSDAEEPSDTDPI